MDICMSSFARAFSRRLLFRVTRVFCSIVSRGNRESGIGNQESNPQHKAEETRLVIDTFGSIVIIIVVVVVVITKASVHFSRLVESELGMEYWCFMDCGYIIVHVEFVLCCDPH
jgi:hypothetical protein